MWETLLAYEADGDYVSTHQMATATVIMDLVKAFERVQLVHVWKWGLYYGFTKALLAMVLTYFGYARRLVVDGCYTESLETCTAIVAGSRFSVCILRLMLQWPMEQLQKSWPDLRLKVFVDDASLQLRREQWWLAMNLPRLVDQAQELLEQMGLEISKGTTWQPGGKSKVVLTSKWLKDKLTTTFKRRGMAMVTEAVYLGVDVAPDQYRKCRRMERRAIFARRVNKVVSLKRGGK